jgi:hypothetical protein
VKESLTWPARYARTKAGVAAAPSDLHRFCFLGELAKAAFEVGAVDEAQDHAQELLTLAGQFRDNWNYGNAIHDGHSTLGRVALSRGDLPAAKHELLQAGRTPGSPQLNSFGPNVSLARDLLKSGEVATVAEYFGLCRVFWEMEDGKLDHWIALASSGDAPDFGPNLFY